MKYKIRKYNASLTMFMAVIFIFSYNNQV